MLDYYRSGIINSIKTIESVLRDAELESIERAELLFALDYLKSSIGYTK